MSLQDPEFDQFKLAYQEARFEDALASLNTLLHAHPQSFSLRWHRARVLEKLERFDEARKAVDDVLQTRHDFVPALILQVQLDMYRNQNDGNFSEHELKAQEQSQLENIEQRLRNILQLDANAVDALQLLSAILRNKPDAQSAREARALLDHALTLAPQRIDLLEDRANTLTASAIIADDKEHHESVATVTTFSGVTYSRDLLEQALADFQTCYALTNLHRYGLRCGALLHDLGRYNEALAAYDKVLARVPEDDPHRPFIIERRARSENNGGGEREQMAKMLEATISNQGGDRTQDENAAAHMILSAAKAVRSGKSVSAALDNFADLNDPDSITATNIATQIYNMIGDEAPGLVAVNPKDFPAYQRKFSAQCKRKLSKFGITHIADAEAQGMRLKLGQRVMLSFFRDESADTGIACYAMQPKKTSLLKFLLLLIKGKWKTNTMIECITHFDNGDDFTTQYESISPFEYNPPIYIEKLSRDAPLSELIERHMQRLAEHQAINPHIKALKATDLAGIEARWVANNKSKLAYRKAIGYATDAELRKMLGANYDRLGDKIKAKLQQFRAA